MSAVQELLARAKAKGADEQEIRNELAAAGACLGGVSPEYIAQCMLTVIDAYDRPSTQAERFGKIIQEYMTEKRRAMSEAEP